MDLKITSTQVEDKVPVTIFHLHGWLDSQSEEQFVDAIQKARQAGVSFVLLDLSEVEIITSAGLRAMQKAFQILTPVEDAFKVAHLKLSGAPPHIYHVLGITGFLHNVPIYESVQDALLSFQN
jgi:anti-anti-sigma factor